MLSFKENFFFFRFSVLFFILTIFGYWGIDLNSEELYIAFSFFVLVIAVFMLVRSGVLFFFVKAVNAKYSRIVADLLLTVAALRLQIVSLSVLANYLTVFLNLASQFLVFLSNFVKFGLPVFGQVYSSKFLRLHAAVNVSAAVFVRNCIKTRKSGIFFGKFFDITL